MKSNPQRMACLCVLYFQIAPDFKQDHLHAHLWRVCGVFFFSLLLISFVSMYNNDRLDKRAYALSRLTVGLLHLFLIPSTISQYVFSMQVLKGYVSIFVFTPQPLRAVQVLFSPIASGWAGWRAGGGKKFVQAVSQKP